MGIRKDLLVTEEIAESSGPQGDPLSSRVSDCLATPLALASSWKSKGAARRIVKDKGSGLIKSIETHRKKNCCAKNWKILMRRNSDRPACVATRQRQDAENHPSYTMIPPDTGCSPLCYCEAPKRIGLTMVSILAAISSAGMRLRVWNQRRAAPKTAQAAVVAGSDASAPIAIL